ncbi:hypothetical protein WAI453_001099 [Rhynchosporium graminicola]
MGVFDPRADAGLPDSRESASKFDLSGRARWRLDLDSKDSGFFYPSLTDVERRILQEVHMDGSLVGTIKIDKKEGTFKEYIRNKSQPAVWRRPTIGLGIWDSDNGGGEGMELKGRKHVQDGQAVRINQSRDE